MISEARGMAQGVLKLSLVLVRDERGHWKLCDNSDAASRRRSMGQAEVL